MDVYELECSSGIVVSVGGQLPRKSYSHNNFPVSAGLRSGSLAP